MGNYISNKFKSLHPTCIKKDKDDHSIPFENTCVEYIEKKEDIHDDHSKVNDMDEKKDIDLQ